jgi:membrane protease YdiL (CAAX protease family)
LVVSSLLFALLHAMNPEFGQHPFVILGLLLAGLYLGSAYLITGSLWLSIFLHVGWNLMEGPFFGLPVSGIMPPASWIGARDIGPQLWTGGSFGPEAGLLLCLLQVVHIGALWSMRPLFRRGSGRPEPAVPNAALSTAASGAPAA